MVDNSNTSVSYSAYQPSGQLGSKLEHVIITFQKNEIPLFGRAVEVAGWQSIFIVILCTLKQAFDEQIQEIESEVKKIKSSIIELNMYKDEAMPYLDKINEVFDMGIDFEEEWMDYLQVV